MAILPSETIMDDETPIYLDYIYIVDGYIRRNNWIYEGTVKDLKREFKATEVRRCELFAPERKESRINNKA